MRRRVVRHSAAAKGDNNMSEIKEALIGKRIKGFLIEPDGSYVTIEFDGHPAVRLQAYGDCCSTSWIESVDAPAALLGTVRDVEEIDMPNLGNIDGQRHKDVDQVSYYGLKITTDKGRCVIDYRNDSNGYYGGWLEVVAPPESEGA
jgi:hypothetical protein